MTLSRVAAVEAASPEALDERDCRPLVAPPTGGVPGWVLALLALALGLTVLLVLNGRRTARVHSGIAATYVGLATPALPPSLIDASASLLQPRSDAGSNAGSAFARLDAAAEEAPFATPIAIRPRLAGAMPQAAFDAPPSAPIAGSEGGPAGMRFPTQPMPGGPISAAAGRGVPAGGSAVVYDGGPGTAGAGLGDDKPGEGAVRASLIRNRPSVVAQGEILPATLETPVSSSRPGPIRAIVARDVRSFDGSRVLIPRGSRLVGEYRADPAAGRRRVLATWTRLIRPDGVAIRIDSPAADSTGGTGMPGRVDTHFLARFANAALQSALQIGVNVASRPGNGSVIVANSSQVSNVMGQNLVPGADEPPTVSVPAGAAIGVFVARDLDFSGVPAVR
ncbi:TrbI/VirB10 family protein [Sphingomonas sp. GV3]|uniref:TrbI/VirB10 family protein n=1 Tax=Sphingomonas sp. GV3 TaxID=3040671 RepID=UPI00280B72BB|nr:TrbI/VirB10 family protein [Sphingomonas sp. GV3]